MTNWEWLLRGGVVDATEQICDSTEMTDSREKLEADIWSGCEHLTTFRMSEKLINVPCGKLLEWLDRQAEITRRETLLENPLHNNPYVGMVRGKQWERKESSDYYCGKCGWKVTDHYSYCPECGGALHESTLGDSDATGERQRVAGKVYIVEACDELIESWCPLGVYMSREAAGKHAESLRGEVDGVMSFARVVEMEVLG